MSYQQRERKRRGKVKAQQMVQGAKRTHSDETAVRYYLIYARKDCRCAASGCVIHKGLEMVYRRSGPVLLCVLCADKDPLVDYRPSAAWEARTLGKNPGRARAEASRHRRQSTRGQRDG